MATESVDEILKRYGAQCMDDWVEDRAAQWVEEAISAQDILTQVSDLLTKGLEPTQGNLEAQS